jgi:hypothetical protein
MNMPPWRTKLRPGRMKFRPWPASDIPLTPQCPRGCIPPPDLRGRVPPPTLRAVQRPAAIPHRSKSALRPKSNSPDRPGTSTLDNRRRRLAAESRAIREIRSLTQARVRTQ